VVWGRRDFCFHDWFLQRWQAVYPHAEVAAYADAGHYVLEDEPAAVGRISEFLRRP
jgi:haloalkane dehalogenase